MTCESQRASLVAYKKLISNIPTEMIAEGEQNLERINRQVDVKSHLRH